MRAMTSQATTSLKKEMRKVAKGGNLWMRIETTKQKDLKMDDFHGNLCFIIHAHYVPGNSSSKRLRPAKSGA
jgi:hypothetical protein